MINDDVNTKKGKREESPDEHDKRFEEELNEIVKETAEEEEEEEESDVIHESDKKHSRAYTIIRYISCITMLLYICNSALSLINGSKPAKNEILKSPEVIIGEKVNDVLERLLQPKDNFNAIISDLHFLGSSLNSEDTSVLVKNVAYTTNFISSLLFSSRKISDQCENPIIVQLIIYILNFLHDFVLSDGILRINNNSALINIFKSCGENVLIVESLFSFLFSIVHANKEVGILNGLGESIVNEAINMDTLLGYQKSLLFFARWNETTPLKETDNAAACSLLQHVLKLPDKSIETKKIIGYFYNNVVCPELYTDENVKLFEGFSEL